jgi:hypothetical protein
VLVISPKWKEVSCYEGKGKEEYDRMEGMGEEGQGNLKKGVHEGQNRQGLADFFSQQKKGRVAEQVLKV